MNLIKKTTFGTRLVGMAGKQGKVTGKHIAGKQEVHTMAKKTFQTAYANGIAGTVKKFVKTKK